MASTIMLVFSLFMVVTLNSVRGYKLPFPRYSFRDHPIYRHQQFKDQHFRPKPVVMRRYIKHNHLGLTDADGMVFSVGKAKYFNFPDGTPLGDPLDALYTSFVANAVEKKDVYLEVELNLNTRVFLVMVTGRMEDEELANVKKVTGLGGNWRNLRSIKTKDGKPIRIGSRARSTSYELPGSAYVLESYFPWNATIRLPTPRRLQVDGRDVVQYFLFFAKPMAPKRPAVAHKYPETPTSITDLANGRKIYIQKPIVPNEECPAWLHDLHRAMSRDFKHASSQNEKMYWRTWHPMVDPLYWCYFDHEHGSYPGRYRPLFDYTAWKTPDKATSHGRQNESDEGFKVFSFPLHRQKKFVIMTVHMQCSKSRRFHARHHTMIFAVLDENWRLQMELQMKMDFGFGLVAMTDFGIKTINQEQEKIKQELRGPIKRFRRFNVINLDKYPRNIDKKYRTRTGAKPTMANKDLIQLGVYEKWSGPLNTCQVCKSGPLDAFIFDIRNAATAKKYISDPDSAPMTKLRGDSVDRAFVISHRGDVLVGPKYCRFLGTTEPRGVFYTDPYFGNTFSSPGWNRVRQFIRAGFETVVFKSGEYSAIDPWAGHYEMSTDHTLNRRSHSNIEQAVIADIN